MMGVRLCVLLLLGLFLLGQSTRSSGSNDPLGAVFEDLSPDASFDLLVKHVGKLKEQGRLPGVKIEISDWPRLLAGEDHMRYLHLRWEGSDPLQLGASAFSDLEVTMFLGDQGVCIEYFFLYEDMNEEKKKGECS